MTEKPEPLRSYLFGVCLNDLEASDVLLAWEWVNNSGGPAMLGGKLPEVENAYSERQNQIANYFLSKSKV